MGNLFDRLGQKLDPKEESKEGPSTIAVSTLLEVKHFRPDPKTGIDKLIQFRRVRDRAVTTVFVNLLVDALEANTNLSNFKYHASGTGTNAEAAADTALQTAIAEARDVGTQVDGASANIYKSVAVHTYAGTFAVTEHGLFDASSAGNLMDRTVFSAINVVSGDKIEFTFQITFAAGG